MIITKIKQIIQASLLSLGVVALILSPVAQPAYAESSIDSTSNSLGKLFNECRVSEKIKNKTDASGNLGSKAIMGCIKQVVNFIFIIAIFIIIFRVIGYQVGVIVDTSGSGEGPIAYTRKALKDGLIGLILIGAPALFLNILNTSATAFIFDFGDSKAPTSGGADEDLNNNNPVWLPASSVNCPEGKTGIGTKSDGTLICK